MIDSNQLGYFYLGAIALLSFGLVQLTELEGGRSLVVPPHSPDYFSHSYQKWEMDGLGKLTQQWSTDSIVHFSDDGITRFQKPLFHFYNSGVSPWMIESDNGVLSADGKVLMLNGNVTISRAKTERVRGLRINTSELKVLPQTHYAETNAPTELISAPNRTTGIGMKLVFVEPISLQLLDKVKGRYEKK